MSKKLVFNSYISEETLFFGIIPAMFGLLVVSSLEFITFGCFDKSWVDWILEKVFENKIRVIEVNYNGNDTHVTYRVGVKISVTNFEEVCEPLNKALTQLNRDSAEFEGSFKFHKRKTEDIATEAIEGNTEEKSESGIKRQRKKGIANLFNVSSNI